MIRTISLFLLFSFGRLTLQGQLDEKLALRLAAMPLECLHKEFPNKTSHSADGPADARLLPGELHPVFYGCFDWHSSVHGHWMLIRILKDFPDLKNRKEIIKTIGTHFTRDNIEIEAEYFSKYTVGKNFERTYGWAWLLKLDQELMEWDSPVGRKWHNALQPLTEAIVNLWKDYLPKATYPNRTGVHPNSAFGLAFALDWARANGDKGFEQQIISRALDYYEENEDIPAYLEPDGSDFFSPSLEAADLMRRIYTPEQFSLWLNKYLSDRSIERLCSPPIVSDRNDYQIVHLDGLYLSRAWCMKGIAGHLKDDHPLKPVFKLTADNFIQTALPTLSAENYGGGHWLASFAVYAIEGH